MKNINWLAVLLQACFMVVLGAALVVPVAGWEAYHPEQFFIVGFVANALLARAMAWIKESYE